MSKETDDAAILRRYLLGISEQSERALVEERLLRGTEFYQELLIAEDEVVDQYVTNELSAEETDHFEKNFLVTPERLQKVRFARGLNRYIKKAADSKSVESIDRKRSEQPEASGSQALFAFLNLKNPVARYAFAAVVLLAIGGVVWLTIRNTQTMPPAGRKAIAVTLTPGLTRGSGQTGEIELAKDVEVLQLRLALPTDEYQSYQAELVREGRTELVKDGLKPETGTGNFLNLTLDAHSLPAGDYQVRVSGVLPNKSHERLQGYHFRIQRDVPVK